ncbi:TetR/AcrR family transcriptional regulator [Paractinoplanes lichenicola]|uniref:TetR/AcrR family transcriptional regulator n=1 Tax=Paractinoplanes lichenicola TaxID=2802976 RepID=A0ABS1VFN1_9ACTN|nr:TetR/AcrR family transcriptional regulator [Actinoplanes lichenicola]MBL7253509.1 TetR/AcrR family transcriptional regulator [Actinoplanes lichenicola]
MSGPRRAAIGRPRGFDVDVALERAMLVFWRRGYEGASLVDLTGAMGITKTSMYAAFGNKEQLFLKALRRYAEGPAGYVDAALALPAARAVVEAILRGAARTSTSPPDFAGCLTVQGALACSDESRPAYDLLVQWRNDAADRLEERFGRAADEGDLPPGADPRRLARYVMTVAFGLSVQAANGLGRAELDEVVDETMRHWQP